MRKAGHRTLIVLTCLILLAALPVVAAVVPIGKEGAARPFIVKKGTRLWAIAHDLKGDNRVFSEYLFLACSLLLHGGRVVAGEYELSDGMSTYGIAGKMARGSESCTP